MCPLAAFITEHCGDDPDRLALQKGKWPEIDVAAAVSTLVSRRKLAGKAPLWAGTDGLVLPRTLSAEQCSGEAAARHKAAVALRIMTELQHSECPGAEPGDAQSECAVKSADGGGARPRIADLTGGLGVDSLEFSRVAETMLYNEMLPELAAAAEHNFKVLGARNIEVCSIEADAETLCGGSPEMMLPISDVCRGSLRRRLEDFRPDIVFLDPARRDGCGKKVFLLEDCSPDILKIKDMLLEIAPALMLKLSPMADISMLLDRLGGKCRELHVIESGGECKELLVIMRREKNFKRERNGLPGEIESAGDIDETGDVKEEMKPAHGNDCLIRVYNLDRVNGGEETDSPVFEFRRGEEQPMDRNGDGRQPSGRPLFAESEEIVPGALLFEPGKALMKAGCFRLIGMRLGAPALGRDTHYYILRENTPDAATETSQAKEMSSTAETSTAKETSSARLGEHSGGLRSLKNAGKLFRILDVTEMSGKAAKDFSRRHPEAEVTARNVRMTSEELRKRLGCRPSDRHHIFALHADRPDRNLLLFTERI